MLNLFNEKAFSEVVRQLGELGYRNELLREGYKFPDWFANKDIRETPAAAFYQTPASYETAMFGVVFPNGKSREKLIDDYRALGAPVVLEVDINEIREWSVSKNEGDHILVTSVPFDGINEFFVERAPVWKPKELLRYKNIGTFPWVRQNTLFAGLLPELEEKIQDSLEPLLNQALAATKSTYEQTTRREPNPARLFKLIFAILTSKVFHDRRVNSFTSLTADADRVLEAYDRKHNEHVSALLNRQSRQVAVSHIWNALDFRHLSVEVLGQMWSTMLIDKETRKRLGIHRTSRTLVRYIVEQIELEQSGDDNRIIFEPCSGSSTFLVGAMNQLRPKLWGMSPPERHKYFIKRLVGMEKDPLGVEISKLVLTLADFPNTGANWQIIESDVFQDGSLVNYLRQAGAVLCNPPFRDFDADEREGYGLVSFHKPVELLERVLADLHPSGILGFVLPRQIADGRAYKPLRQKLAERFASLNLTALPDRAFPDASTESALLIATEPFPHNKSKLTFSKVRDNERAWKQFDFVHQVSFRDEKEITPEEANTALAMPELPDVWSYLSSNTVLKSVADVHRGLEWNVTLKIGESWLIRNEPAKGYILGVAPETKFHVFEVPEFRYLNREKKFKRRNAYAYEWEKPKVIFGKAPRSRGAWKIAAFADTEGVACFQSYYGVWPTAEYDIHILTAILNSPVANAFIASRESRREITKENLNYIPLPRFTEAQEKKLRDLIERYQKATKPFFMLQPHEDAESLLKQIDALVLDAYQLPPRLEHQILKYFEGQNSERETAHAFSDYLPVGYESFFSLSMHISPKFKQATAGALRERTRIGLET